MRWLRYLRRIERNPEIQHGEPCIAGTRMPTWTVQAYFGPHEPNIYMFPYWQEQYGEHYTLDDLKAAYWYESLPHRRIQRWWEEHGWSVVRNRDRGW